jgi:protease I
MSQKILIIVAPTDFRDEEVLEPKKVFQENGFNVYIASKGTNLAKGKLGAELPVDLDIKDVSVEDYQVIMLAGGPGANDFIENPTIKTIILDTVEKDILLAAICIAPKILALNGFLKGRKATVWDGDGNQSKLFAELGIEYTGEKVTVDGKIITGNGPEAAMDFAKKVADLV